MSNNPAPSIINFFSEDIQFELPDEDLTISWIKIIIEKEQFTLRDVNIIFCSDAYLLRLNIDFLDHNTLTDVITFPYANRPIIKGDIFISVERVKENANQFSGDFLKELNRVIIHGILHLCGYKDKTTADAKLMRQKENAALLVLESISSL